MSCNMAGPPRLWVARTEPGASRLAAALRDAGFDVLKAPVLRIEQLQSELPPQCFDLAVFVSEHAVEGAASNGWFDSRRHDQPTVAIGTAAHNALRQRALEPLSSPFANAAEVVDALSPVPGRTLIVKGEGGRDVLRQGLQQRGGNVAEWNVYRRLPTTPNIAQERIDAIVASSGDGANAAVNCWRNSSRDNAVPFLVPSQRVAAQVRRLGFPNVVVTLGASAPAVLQALAQLRLGTRGACSSARGEAPRMKEPSAGEREGEPLA